MYDMLRLCNAVYSDKPDKVRDKYIICYIIYRVG